jgi:hypothetical protein
MRWSPHTQPLPGVVHEFQHSDVIGSVSGADYTFRREHVGRHRQQNGVQDGTAASSGSASDPYADSFALAQPEPSDPYLLQAWPQQLPIAPGTQPRVHHALPHRNRKIQRVLIGFGALVVIIAAISAAIGRTSSTIKPTASSAAAPSAAHYADVRDLLAALAQHGVACSDASIDNGSTVNGALNPYADCSGVSSGDTVIVMFQDHADAVAYANSMLNSEQSTGGATAEVVGPDWTVNSVPAYAEEVVEAIGGQLMAKPSSPASASPSAAPSTTPTNVALQNWCQGQGFQDYQNVDNDLDQIKTDSGDEDLPAVENDGLQLFNDAHAAGTNLPPVDNTDKLNYGLAMGWLLIAGDKLGAGDLTDAESDIATANGYLGKLTNLIQNEFPAAGCLAT